MSSIHIPNCEKTGENVKKLLQKLSTTKESEKVLGFWAHETFVAEYGTDLNKI